MSALFRDKYLIGSKRLSGFDYTSPGKYFITIDTWNMSKYFGKIESGLMVLNEFGKIAARCWREIPDHSLNVTIDEFIVMPDHIHGIICINDCSAGSISIKSKPGMENEKPLQATVVPQSDVWLVRPEKIKDEYMSSISPGKGSLATIIRSYKSGVSRIIHKIDPAFKWHSRYYDHIIRNDGELFRIRKYIRENPSKKKP